MRLDRWSEAKCPNTSLLAARPGPCLPLPLLQVQVHRMLSTSHAKPLWPCFRCSCCGSAAINPAGAAPKARSSLCLKGRGCESKQQLTPHLMPYTPPTLSTHFSTHLPKSTLKSLKTQSTSQQTNTTIPKQSNPPNPNNNPKHNPKPKAPKQILPSTIL